MKNKNIILAIVFILLLIIGGYYFSVNKNNGVEVINSNNETETGTTTDTTAGTPKTTTTNGTTVKTGTTYPSNAIKIGQRTLINGVYITPTKVTYDGRCPADVKCIQAGTVDLGVFIEQGTTTQDVIITLNRPLLIGGKIGNKTMTLTSVSPSKTSTKTLKASDYRFTFSVK